MSRGAAWASWAGLATAIGVAAFLRFDGLGEPSYWLDEVLGQLVVHRAPSIPWWHWLTGVHPQHGPLYYALQWLAFVLRDDEWGGRFFAAVFGLAAVPLLWMAARTAMNGRSAITPLMGAALLAISPLHVYYSREARPYALLVLLVTIALLAILRRSPLLAGAALVLMLYTSVASASAVASIAFAAFASSWLERDARARWRLAIIALAAVLVLASFPFLYRAASEERVGSVFPGLNLSLADSVVRGLGVTALASARGGRTAYVVLVLAIVGAIALIRRNRSAAGALIAMTCLPVLFSVAGLLAQNHFFGIRYVIAALPAYLLLAGFGIATIVSLVRVPRVPAFVPALAIIGMIAVQTWPAARAEAFRKLDWRGIARTIHQYARPGDLVMMAEPWSGIVLHHYLGRLPPKVKALQISFVPLARVAVQEHPAAWLVSGGFSTDVAVRAWMCGFPVVLASPLENFRMHYTSRTGGDFLRERAGLAEWRAVAAALGEQRLTLQMTPQEELLLDEGWSGPEGGASDSFRWTIGERAMISLPRFGREDRMLRMRVSPLDHPSLPPQTMRIELNGRELQTVTLRPGAQELSFPTPGALWRDGLNTLTFHFGRATAAAELDPSNGDQRKLAVSFDWIVIGDAGAPTLPALAVRLPPIVEKKDTTDTRFPPERLDRAAVVKLLGRIGIDPATTWPKLMRGEARLEDLIETVAYGADCMDDATFVRTSFELIIGRAPGTNEQEDLATQLRNGTPRVRLIHRLLRFEEVDLAS